MHSTHTVHTQYTHSANLCSDLRVVPLRRTSEIPDCLAGWGKGLVFDGSGRAGADGSVQTKKKVAGRGLQYLGQSTLLVL